jgi:hypothetical protein
MNEEKIDLEFLERVNPSFIDFIIEASKKKELNSEKHKVYCKKYRLMKKLRKNEGCL